jgi:hypothetical protein
LPQRARALALALTIATSFLLGAVPGAAPEPVAAAAPKVAILVGPTAITDSHYHKWAKELKATAEAAGATVDLRYCPTPNQAKNATSGANVIVYFGHGNGFPNPYSGTEHTAWVNGWGLRDPAKSWNKTSCTDSVLRYYGEDYLTGKISGYGWTGGGITPADGFVMVYSNACYAPGAGESRPAPSESVALQRVSNYSTPILELGGTYFATDLGSDRLVDLILRNRSTAFGTIFELGSGYRESALRRHPHPDVSGQEAWVHRTKSEWLGDDYWYAFAGDPARAPNGSTPGYAALVVLPFSDIADSKFVDEIVWLAETEITTGCGGTKFCPRDPVSRGQMATFLTRALQLPPASKDWYPDDDGNRHEDSINRLAEAGITTGCAKNRFCPDSIVKRGQMATFLARALHLPEASGDWYTDDAGLIHEDSINRLADSGITTGCASTAFCPTSKVRREQMAAFLYRAQEHGL